MRRAAIVAMGLLLAGCAETVGPDAGKAGDPTSAGAVKPVPQAAPRKEASLLPVPQPKPKTVVYLEVTPPDAALEKAVREALTARGTIELRRPVVPPPADAAVLTVRHFRWNEGERAEAVRTISYRADQVSAQALPPGASYQVDHVSGTATVGFSFRLSVERGGRKLAESEVSDRVEAPWSTCRLARVVEATGAAKAAPFIANDEMRALCAGMTAATVSAGGLSRLAEAVQALPLNGK